MVGAVQSKKLLQRRVDYYLWESSGSQATGFRDFYEKYLQDKTSAIIGGVLRDIAFVGTHRYKTFNSDIDVVIEASTKEVKNLAGIVNAKKNSFGGYSVFYDNKVKIDFWALENTWSARYEACKLDKIRDVINWTFFNLDSIIYILKDKEIFWGDDDDFYMKMIRDRKIEVVKKNNPRIEKNIIKAFQRMCRLDIQFSESFEKMILDKYLTSDLLKELEAKLPDIVFDKDSKTFYRKRDEQLNLFNSVCNNAEDRK